MVKLSLLNFAAITASATAQCVSIADLVCRVTLSTLCDCINESGLQPALTEGQWTLFAPTNHAFYQIEGQLSEIRENPDMLASLIMYHAVEEVVYTNSLSCSGTLEMASGQTCTTVCQNGIIYQTGEANSVHARSKIVAENVEACNGVVHIVNNVMLPENLEPDSNNPSSCQTIVDIACNNDDFSTLCAAIKQAGLETTLSSGIWTVFAPTNDAFANLGYTLDAVLADNALLTNVLRCHLVNRPLFASDLQCGGTINMENGEPSTTVCEGEIVFQVGLGNSPYAMPQIVSTDIEACNGVIHVVNEVLLPNMEDMMPETEDMMPDKEDIKDTMHKTEDMMPEIEDMEDMMSDMEDMMPEIDTVEGNVPEACSSIVDIACSNDDFSTLCAAITQAGLETTLSSGIWTVFAPTNEAFANLGYTLDAVLADNALLTTILLHHVVDKATFSSDLRCSKKIKMADGKKTRTVCVEDAIFQTGKGNSRETMPQIVSVDIEACNGVIHVIDEVILPKMKAMRVKMPEMEDMMPEMGDMMPEMEDMMPEMEDKMPEMEGMTSEMEDMMPEMEDMKDMMPEMEDMKDMLFEMEDMMLDMEEKMLEMEEMMPDLAEVEESGSAGCRSIADIACSNDDFSTLCAAVTQAGLGATLSEGSWTVFAPTNEAFANLGGDTLDAVLADNELLFEILLYHVVDEVVFSTDLKCNKKVTMANGKKSCTICIGESIFQTGKGNPRNGMPEIVSIDIEACNGVIHVVNEVILPKL